MLATSLGIAGIVLLSSCASKTLDSQAASTVNIVEDEPHHCQWLGEVHGTQGNIMTGLFTTDEELVAGAKNEILNQAYQLGANSLWITRTNPSRTHNLDFYSFYGKAYKC